MKNITKTNLLLMALFCTFTAFGQQNEDNSYRMTLQECIETAIKNNVQVKQSGLQVIGSQVAVEQAKAERWPSVNGSVGYSYNIGRSINPFTNLYEENPVSSQNYGLNANVTLFNGMRIHNTVQRNQVDLEASQYDLEAVKNNITLDVISAYTQILFNRELLENARFQLENTNLQLERTQKLVEAGSLPIANELELEAQQASREAEIINAENNVALAKLQLKQMMQMPASNIVEIVVPEVEVPATETLVMSSEDVYEAALETQPAIKSVEAQITSAEYNVSIARSGFYPSLFLRGSLGTAYSSVAPDVIPRGGAENVTRVVPTGAYIINNPQMLVVEEQTVPTEFQDNTYFNQLNFNLNRFVGVSLSIPIFNNLQVKSSVSNAEIGLENARLVAINEKIQLRQAIEQAYANAKAAATTYFARERQVEALQLSFKNTETSFNLGAVNALEYSQAQNNLNAAQSDLIRAKYDYIFSLKVLDFYKGKPLAF